MATYTTQESRQLSLSTPLGPDVLLLTAFTGREELSRLFSYQLEVLSEEEAISPNGIVGKSVTWCVQQVDKEPRYFNGFVSRFAAGGRHLHGLRAYRLEVVPWFWFLTRTANCRIFQNVTTPQIVETIFKDYGFTDYELNLQRSYPKWEYCVQYRETAFNFVSRLLEHEGIFYYFRHEDGKHTLVLADHKGAYKDCPENEVDYTAGSVAPNHIDSWEHQYEFRPGKWAQTDYNFETPSTNLLTTSKTLIDLPSMSKFEIFDYPGEYRVKGDGEADTKVRMEEDEVPYDVATGSSRCCTFTPGGKFTFEAHEVEAEVGKSYAITSVQHAAVDRSLQAGGLPAEYSNTFTCIPATVAFRPPRQTPKPAVQGPQTAVVVGPAGEEIYVDKYGRVKVQFFWDREGKKNENSSCWMRVSQAYAGKGWGSVCIPRIGQEVIVDFLEGDPDLPLITGRVYNAEQMPPYGLPGKKVVSGLKSNSSPGGGGYNEFILDDTKGNELIRVHGQFDMDSTIEHDLREHVLNNRSRDVTVNETISIGNDRGETVGGNETLSVAKNRTETVGGNETLSVAKNRTRTVSQNESVTVALMRTHNVGINEAITVGAAQEVSVGAFRTVAVGAYQSITVGASQTISVGASQTINVGASQKVTIGASETRSIGADLTETVGKDQKDSVAANRTTKVGADDKLSVAKKLAIDAGDEITITTGQSSITMKSDGTITIKGKAITIEATQKIDEKAMNITSDASTKNMIHGSMVNMEADGINTIKGSLVKIN